MANRCGFEPAAPPFGPTHSTEPSLEGASLFGSLPTKIGCQLSQSMHVRTQSPKYDLWLPMLLVFWPRLKWLV
jgi:hypothetical protein